MFYNRFVQLCHQKGISPSRAAIEAGISKSLVTKWKTNGCKDPSPEVLRKLSAYFHVAVSDLLAEAASPASDILDEVDAAFYGDYKALSEEEKDTLRAMARLMRERRQKREGNP